MSSTTQKPHIDKELLKEKFDISNFDLNAVLRGVQLTLVGAHRALQNPALFTSQHYRHCARAVAAGIAIRIAIALPSIAIRFAIWISSFISDLGSATWDDTIINGLSFIEEHVLQVPLFLMTLMRYISPTLDNLFMDSIRWVDQTYAQKHKDEDPSKLRDMYYPNLRQYKVNHGNAQMSQFLFRFFRKGAISLAVYALSYIPLVGRFVLPAASFYTFNRAVGLGPASLIFGVGVCLPRRYLVIFLQTYFSSRSLMRELLEPYFARIHFSREEKRTWFHNREGILFGFGIGFYTLVRVPLLGVLIYGIAEASTAYLVTKVTDPPPPASQSAGFAARQQVWRNKHEFLNLSLANLDALLDKPPPYAAVDPNPPASARAVHGALWEETPRQR